MAATRVFISIHTQWEAGKIGGWKWGSFMSMLMKW